MKMKILFAEENKKLFVRYLKQLVAIFASGDGREKIIESTRNAIKTSTQHFFFKW